VRYLGCSNYQAYQLAKALWLSDRLGLCRFECDQPRYNLLYREIENEICRFAGPKDWSHRVQSLAGGFLTGRYTPGSPYRRQAFRLHQAGELYQNATGSRLSSPPWSGSSVLRRTGPLPRQVALAWVLGQPGITSGSSEPAARAARPESSRSRLELDPEELAFCDDVWFELPRLRHQRRFAVMCTRYRMPEPYQELDHTADAEWWFVPDRRSGPRPADPRVASTLSGGAVRTEREALVAVVR